MAKKIAKADTTLILTDKEAVAFQALMYDIFIGGLTRTKYLSSISDDQWKTVNKMAGDIVTHTPISAKEVD